MRRPTGLTWRMAVLAAIAAIVVAAGVGLLIGASVSLHHAEQRSSRGQNALLQAARTESLAEDLETGLRGYAITRNPTFLQPYQAALGELPATEANLMRSLGGVPGQASAARSTIALLRAYTDDYAPQVLTTVPPPGASCTRPSP